MQNSQNPTGTNVPKPLPGSNLTPEAIGLMYALDAPGTIKQMLADSAKRTIALAEAAGVSKWELLVTADEESVKHLSVGLTDEEITVLRVIRSAMPVWENGGIETWKPMVVDGYRDLSIPVSRTCSDLTIKRSRNITFPNLDKPFSIECDASFDIKFPAVTEIGLLSGCQSPHRSDATETLTLRLSDWIELPSLTRVGGAIILDSLIGSPGFPEVTECGDLKIYKSTGVRFQQLERCAELLVRGNAELPVLRKAGKIDLVDDEAGAIFPSLVESGAILATRSVGVSFPVLRKAGNVLATGSVGLTMPVLEEYGFLSLEDATQFVFPHKNPVSGFCHVYAKDKDAGAKLAAKALFSIQTSKQLQTRAIQEINDFGINKWHIGVVCDGYLVSALRPLFTEHEFKAISRFRRKHIYWRTEEPQGIVLDGTYRKGLESQKPIDRIKLKLAGVKRVELPIVIAEHWSIDVSNSEGVSMPLLQDVRTCSINARESIGLSLPLLAHGFENVHGEGAQGLRIGPVAIAIELESNRA